MLHEAPLPGWHNPCSVLTSCEAAHPESGPPSCLAQALTPHSGTLYLNVVLTSLGSDTWTWMTEPKKGQAGILGRVSLCPLGRWHTMLPSPPQTEASLSLSGSTHLCCAALTHGCPCALPRLCEGSLCALLVFSFCFQRYSFFE